MIIQRNKNVTLLEFISANMKIYAVAIDQSSRMTAGHVGSVFNTILVAIFYCDTKSCRQHILFDFIVCESLIAAKRRSETWIHCSLYL